jgi:hypothetical protein
MNPELSGGDGVGDVAKAHIEYHHGEPPRPAVSLMPLMPLQLLRWSHAT